MARRLDFASSSAGLGHGGAASPTLNELIACVETWLPPAIRTITTCDKIKLFDAIAMMYRKRDENRRMAHEQYRQIVQLHYQVKHPELMTFRAEMYLAPSLLQMLQDGSEAAIRHIVCSHGPLLYSFDMLQPRICSLLLDEVQNMEHWLRRTNIQKMPPNSMNSNGVVLDDFGFSPVLDMLVQYCVTPLVSVLFPQLGRAPLDSHHGYPYTSCAAQSSHADHYLGSASCSRLCGFQSLVRECHVDNSEVTLNVSLSSPIEGGDLYFRGVRCIQHLEDPERDMELAKYHHVPGRALLHMGRHRHGAHAVVRGKRVNLVLWCRSSHFRECAPPAFVCPPWCNATNKHTRPATSHH